MPKNEGYEFEVLRNYDTLQRVVRNPDYGRLCENLTFDGDGFAEIDTVTFSNGTSDHVALPDRECEAALKALQERISQQEGCLENLRKTFGLIQPIQPSVILQHKHRPEFFSQIPIFEKDPFACMLVFQRSKEDTVSKKPPKPVFPGSEEDGGIVSSPIHDTHYLVTDIDLLAPAKAIKSAVKEYLEMYREYLPMTLKGTDSPACEFLHAGMDHARFKVNMLSFDKDIFQEIEKYTTPPKNHMHFEKRNGCYAVWDRRREQEPFSKITLRLGLNEDQARKRFRRAFTLVTGKEYNESIWKELILDYLVKKAKSSSGQEQVEAYKELGKFEKVKQQNRLLMEKEGSEEEQKRKRWMKENIPSNSLCDDPRVAEILIDIKRLCRACPDTECKAKGLSNQMAEDLSNFDCPQIYKFLTN